jgi:glutathione-regulated potassium-efflux system ancillary protein KefC
MSHDVLFQAFLYLCAAVLFVPIAKRLGLGAVLGYLLAGVVIGPDVLQLARDPVTLMHFSEFGVVMMLFVVGLELRPALLWQMRKPIFGLGGAQVVGCALVIGLGALLFGVPWKAAVAVGLTFAMSSTAIVISSLTERGLLKGEGGQASFSVLLFQDISVIPILAVFPLLGLGVVRATSGGDSTPAWQTALISVGAVVGVFAIGRYVVRPMFTFLAGAKLRESFTAATLLIVIGIALLMQLAGLSAALGTFMAGVLLADSEYRHELETDLEPFKGLLLGLFFITVGAGIDFDLIASAPLTIAGIVLGSMTVKLLVMRLLGKLFGLARTGRWLFAFSLAQIGEFAFVLLQLGVQQRVFSAAFAGPLVAAVAISMVLTPLLFIILERWVLPRVTEREADRPQDEIHDAHAPVVIAGYGRFGQIVGRILRANNIAMTILDLDPEMIDVLSRLEIKAYYGDASRVELLQAAGCEHAKLLVIAVDDPTETKKIAEHALHHFPKLPIIARCRSRVEYWELRKLGIKTVVRETFAASYETGIMALRELGYRAFTAQRLAQRWRQHEETLIEEIGKHWGEEDYWERSRASMIEAERLMRQEDPRKTAHEHGWDNESLRADTRVDEAARPLADTPTPS